MPLQKKWHWGFLVAAEIMLMGIQESHRQVMGIHMIDGLRGS